VIAIAAAEDVSPARVSVGCEARALPKGTRHHTTCRAHAAFRGGRCARVPRAAGRCPHPV